MATEATTTESNVVDAQPRAERGKNETRRVRRGGHVPAVLYGAKKPTLTLSVDTSLLKAPCCTSTSSVLRWMSA